MADSGFPSILCTWTPFFSPLLASPSSPLPASLRLEALRREFLSHPDPLWAQTWPRPSTLGSCPGATCHVVQHMVLRSDW